MTDSKDEEETNPKKHPRDEGDGEEKGEDETPETEGKRFLQPKPV